MIFFNANTSRLHSENGYFKTALHEIGHTFGLAHPTATEEDPDGNPTDENTKRRGTVMNPNGASKVASAKPWEKRDDFLRFVPDKPTICDIEAVNDALTK